MKHHQRREPPNLHIIHKSQKQMHVQFCNVYWDRFLSHSPGAFFPGRKCDGVVYMYINHLHLLYGTSSRMFVFIFTSSFFFHRGNLPGLIQVWYMYTTSPKMSVLSSGFHKGNLHRLTIQIWYMHATSPQRSVLSASFHRGNLHRLIVHIWYMHATYLQRSVLSPSFHRGDCMDLSWTYHLHLVHVTPPKRSILLPSFHRGNPHQLPR